VLERQAREKKKVATQRAFFQVGVRLRRCSRLQALLDVAWPSVFARHQRWHSDRYSAEKVFVQASLRPMVPVRWHVWEVMAVRSCHTGVPPCCRPARRFFAIFAVVVLPPACLPVPLLASSLVKWRSGRPSRHWDRRAWLRRAACCGASAFSIVVRRAAGSRRKGGVQRVCCCHAFKRYGGALRVVRPARLTQRRRREGVGEGCGGGRRGDGEDAVMPVRVRGGVTHLPKRNNVQAFADARLIPLV